MKVLMLAHRFSPSIGGVETHLLELSKNLIARGHQVTIFSSNLEEAGSGKKHARALSRHTVDGIEVVRFNAFPLKNSIDSATLVPGQLLAALRHVNHFDILHAHSYGYFSSIAASVIKQFHRTPLVFTPHFAAETVVNQRIRQAYDRFVGSYTLKKASKIIVLTDIEQRAIQRVAKIPDERFAIIPNGVDLERFTKPYDPVALRKKFGIEKDGKIILSVCRMAPNKGLDYLAQAGTKIFKQFPKAKMIMVGQDWGMQAVVSNIASKGGFESSVTFTGKLPLEQMDALYREADVFCLPSIAGEAFGIVYLEAMAGGTPIVATNVGGVPSLVADTENGFLIPPRDSDAIAERTIALLSDERLSDAISKNNLAKAKRYSWSAIAQKTEAVYTSLCGTNDRVD